MRGISAFDSINNIKKCCQGNCQANSGGTPMFFVKKELFLTVDSIVNILYNIEIKKYRKNTFERKFLKSCIKDLKKYCQTDKGVKTVKNEIYLGFLRNYSKVLSKGLLSELSKHEISEVFNESILSNIKSRVYKSIIYIPDREQGVELGLVAVPLLNQHRSLLGANIHNPQGHLDKRPEREFSHTSFGITSASPDANLEGCLCGPIQMKGGLAL